MNTQSRRGMTDAFSTYHLVGRRIVRHQSQWRARAAMVLAPINTLEDAKERARRAHDHFDYWDEARQREVIGPATWDAGIQAYTECHHNHDALDALIKQRYEALRQALYLMGYYHGQQMAALAAVPRSPAFSRSYWRHAREMAKTLRSHIPSNKVVGPDIDFPSTAGWAKALGMRNAKALMDALFGAGYDGSTARNAGNL